MYRYRSGSANPLTGRFLNRANSIKRKLVAIIMLTSSTALLLSCGAFSVFEVIMYRITMVRELSSVAQIVAASSSAAVLFQDRKEVIATLGMLRAEQRLTSACIYLRNGKLFASYSRAGVTPRLPGTPGPDGNYIGDDRLHLFRPILLDGERLGTVYLESDLDEGRARLKLYTTMVMLVLLLALVVAFVLSSRLQRVISEPVLRLAETASLVSASKNYTVRAQNNSNDEVGLLVDNFNEMLSQIHARDTALQKAQDGLEKRVKDRTRALENEVAERRRIESELLAAKEAAEQANRTKSIFLANMSHELRTPLNAVIGYSEMLQEPGSIENVEQAREDLARIERAGKNLLAIINDVLDLSKIEAGKTELHNELFLVATVVEDAVSTVRPLAQSKGNTLLEECFSNVGYMEADLVKVRQSLLNLLSNACKFTQGGSVRVVVLRTGPPGREWIEFRVMDNGIGMSAEQRTKLFKSFSQVDSSTTRKYGGTGLGLAISQRFCQMMGGNISVDSELGQGSTFTMRLPATARNYNTEPIADFSSCSDIAPGW